MAKSKKRFISKTEENNCFNDCVWKDYYSTNHSALLVRSLCYMCYLYIKTHFENIYIDKQREITECVLIYIDKKWKEPIIFLMKIYIWRK